MNYKDVLDQVYTAINNTFDFAKKAFEVQRSLVERAAEQVEAAVKTVKK